MPVINVNLIDTFDQWRIKTNTIINSFGDLDLLNTTVKSDLVSAVNEIRDTAGIQEVVEDTTPSLGGILNLNSYDITGNGNINITGIINGTINLGGDLTGTADSAQIAENTVGITELDLSDGTTGQYLTRNSSSGLSFTTLDISSESVGGDLSGTIGNAQVIPSVITGTAVGGDVTGTVGAIQISPNTVGILELDVVDGTAGQLLARHSSGGLYFTSMTPDGNMDSAVGGDLSGTISNSLIIANAITTNKIADNQVTDPKIVSMDAGKLTGSLSTETTNLFVTSFINSAEATNALAPASSSAAGGTVFFGFNTSGINGATLTVETSQDSSDTFVFDDYVETFLASTNTSFSINSNGHLEITLT